MPPPKKAAKKAAKKATKKAAKKSPHHQDDEKHHSAKDLRRAFEHLGRVQILERQLQAPTNQIIHLLATLAQQRLKAHQIKDGADLLRAAEHLSFAQLAQRSSDEDHLSPALEDAINEQFNDLNQRAAEHWQQDTSAGPISAIYEDSRRQALMAHKGGAFRKALEFARAAEALSHLSPQIAAIQMPTGTPPELGPVGS